MRRGDTVNMTCLLRVSATLPTPCAVRSENSQNHDFGFHQRFFFFVGSLAGFAVFILAFGLLEAF